MASPFLCSAALSGCREENRNAGEILENVRERLPLIQNITNYVTANDCANITLACGASPTMSDGEEEAEEMGRLCDGLNINMELSIRAL